MVARKNSLLTGRNFEQNPARKGGPICLRPAGQRDRKAGRGEEGKGGQKEKRESEASKMASGARAFRVFQKECFETNSTFDWEPVKRSEHRRNVFMFFSSSSFSSLVCVRAAAFCISWRLFNQSLLHQDGKALQQSSLEVTNAWISFAASRKERTLCRCSRIFLVLRARS